MKGISCQCLSTMHIFDLWINNEYIIYLNCKLINIVIYIIPELGTLQWITFNPNYLIRISTVETFNFSP